MKDRFSPQQLDLRRAMGNPQPPAEISQEPYETDVQHLKNLVCTKPGETASPSDLYEYVQDLRYTKIEPVLLRYALPFCLDEWRKELRENARGHSGMIENLYPLLAKPEVWERHLLPQQAAAISDFMRSAILEEIEDQRGLRYEGSKARPYRWISAFTSYGVLRPDIEKLCTEWWKLDSVGRCVAYLQFVSCLMYPENENPIFAPWTPNGGGGPPDLSDFAGHMYENSWLPANVEFLRSVLTPTIVEQNLHRAAKLLEKEPEHPIATEVESDWPLCLGLFVQKCEELGSTLATKQ